MFVFQRLQISKFEQKKKCISHITKCKSKISHPGGF